MNSPARGVFHPRYFAVALTAVLGTLVSIGAFLLVLSWEQRVAEIDFQSKAKSFLEVINADLSDASTLLYTLGAYVDTNEHAVSRRQFERFSKVLHARVIGLRDIGWAPRVTRAQRPAFERGARAAGIAPDYRIVERDAQRQLVTARDRPAYYAILYVETGAIKGPMKRSVLGFNVSSERMRAAAIARAVRTGQPAATPPLRLLTVKGPIGGVMGFMPVGKSRGQRIDAKRPIGVVFGIFETAAMIENIVATKTMLLSGLNLYIFNPAGSPDHRLIYWRSSVSVERQAPAEHVLAAATHWQGTVSMIDQRWGAIITPTAALRSQYRSWPTVTTLAAGLTMTAMIVAYLLISLRRTIYLEGLTASLRDATEDLHRNVAQIAHMARHDALTGLPNRVLFRERIDEAVARHRRDAPFAIFYLDLDHFKAVNDTLGHSAGDRLLGIVAMRIAGCMREVDTIARLGGDEFAIILVDKATPEMLAQVAERLISEVGKPYVIDDHTVVVGVTIGIATATPDGTAEGLLKEADLALYEAKAAGRGTYRFFETRLRLQLEVKRTLEGDLRGGLARGEFEVYYQPIINLAQNRVTALEALVRWNHPEHGLLEPDGFIEVAEECGLMIPLGLWVLRSACEQAAHWPEPVKVAVNISPLQFKSEDVVASVLQCLTNANLPAQRLDIEITEAAVLQESTTTLAVIDQLRAMGVGVAFDDFGTGFSSLSSLLRFPFDKLKIDRSFLAVLSTSHSAAAIVRAIVGLGGNLGLVTTGEGVETREQLADLRRFGCIEAQGYYFSPPRPNSDVPRLLRELDAHAGSAIDMIGV